MVPESMTATPRWVMWRYEDRGGKPTKVPYTTGGRRASVTNPADWTSYESATVAATLEGAAGVGFVLGDGWAGVDLDACRNPETGEVAPWAAEIVDDFRSYTETSPSACGLKIFFRGSPPVAGRRKVGGGAVEVYGGGRYFTVTGEGGGAVANDATGAVKKLTERYFAGTPTTALEGVSTDRVWNAVLALPDAVEGDRGHDKTFRAACEILRWGVDGDAGLALLRRFNAEKCVPPWRETELRHKWKSAEREILQSREFGVALPEVQFEDPPPALDDAVFVPKFDLDIWEVGRFIEAEFPQRWLIKGVLIEQESLVIGGPPKSLKTSIAFDLAISLATGTPFLGRWAPERQANVLILTGESGKPTIQRTIGRILAARGLQGVPPDRLYVGFNLPQLSASEHLEVLERDIRSRGVELCVIDPAYLTTLAAGQAGDASNMFAMGVLLRRLTAIGAATRCVMAVVHHTKRAANGDAPSIADLAWSGWAEWTRQWLMLRPHRAFANGRHRLRASIGGSAGHSGEYGIDVFEGAVEFDEGAINRRWDVTVSPWDDAEAEWKAAKREEQAEQTVDDLRARVVDLLADGIPRTRSAIASAVEVRRNSKGWEALERVLADPHFATSAVGRETRYRVVETDLPARGGNGSR